MSLFSQARPLAALCLAVSLLVATPALAEEFDLSPEQPHRLHAERNQEAIAALPKNFHFAEDGTLSVAVSAFLPPIATYATDARTVVGADPDVGQLIADSLGLKYKLVPVAWPDWPLGVASGKYDAVISNVGVTEERKLKFDFSTYRQGLHGFYVKTSSPIRSIKEPKDIAGLRIITSSGTIQERILLEWDRQNKARGLKPAELLYFDDEAQADIALESGRADAKFDPNAVQAYQAATLGKKRLVGTVNAGWPLTADVGVVTRKDSGLAKPISIAINGLIASGKYKATLARWNLLPESVEASKVNPPGLPKF